ncbi:hypothetical protein GQ53DRAFT_525371 [Thozetella sp. PMI_491]|nr:hypothetical protein GQ53DRAFT_525371 [Thozetella sp. PMI_491]
MAKKKPGRRRRGRKVGQTPSEVTAASPPDPILRLPVEIWVHIFNFVENFPSRYSVHKTCRSFQKMTLSNLYNNIAFCSDLTMSEKLGLLHDDKLWAFTHNILTHPHHASWIQNLHFMAGGLTDTGHVGKVPSSELYSTVFAAVDRVARHRATAKRWKADLRVSGDKRGNKDALVALILPCLPNLRSLRLRVSLWSVYFEPVLERMADINRNVGDDPGQVVSAGVSHLQNDCGGSLGHLEEIILDGHEQNWGVSRNTCMLFLRLPAIHTFRALCTASYGGFYGLPLQQIHRLRALPIENSSGCEHVELVKSRLDDTDVHRILSACRRLKTFRYETNCEHPLQLGVSISALQNSLEVRSATLENLWLDLAPRHPDEGSGLSDAPMRFVGLANIRYLKVNAAFILSPREISSRQRAVMDPRELLSSRIAEIIPSSVERLHFTGISNKRQLKPILSACSVLMSGRIENHKHLAEIAISVTKKFTHDLDRRAYFLTRVRQLQGSETGIRIRGEVEVGRDSMFYGLGLGPVWDVTE